jgi:hypothetical protein
MSSQPFVLSVPEAGRRFYGLGRDASYSAAERGEIPSLKIGRRVVVPIHQVLKQQGMSDDLIARVLLGTTPETTEVGAATAPTTATDIAPTEDDNDQFASARPENANTRHLTGL